MPTDEVRRRGKLALHQLYPRAIQVVKDDLAKGNGDRAEWLIEMHDGKARQQVDTHLTGELVIRVVYEEPPEEKQGGEP